MTWLTGRAQRTVDTDPSPTVGAPAALSIEVVAADIRSVDGDVLVLKHAGGLHGADEVVADALGLRDQLAELPDAGWRRFDHGTDRVAAPAVLFVASPPLHELDYAAIRAFTARALGALAEVAPEAATAVLTLHGVGYGLDEQACLRAQLAGVADALEAGGVGPALATLRLAEFDEQRAARVEAMLGEDLPAASIPRDPASAAALAAALGGDHGERRLAIVAMELGGGTELLYRQGIEPVVRRAGFVCERIVPADLDPIERMRTKIDAAAVVIGVLTGANPNVFFQLGYALGAGVPVVAVSGLGEEVPTVPFDVRSLPSVVFRSLGDLDDGLGATLARVATGAG